MSFFYRFIWAEFGCSAHVPSSTPSITVDAAIAKAEKALGGKYNNWPATVEYVAKDDGSLALTHVVQIQDDAKAIWYEAFVDAHTGELVHITDFVAKASVSTFLSRLKASS